VPFYSGSGGEASAATRPKNLRQIRDKDADLVASGPGSDGKPRSLRGSCSLLSQPRSVTSSRSIWPTSATGRQSPTCQAARNNLASSRIGPGPYRSSITGRPGVSSSREGPPRAFTMASGSGIVGQRCLSGCPMEDTRLSATMLAISDRRTQPPVRRQHPFAAKRSAQNSQTSKPAARKPRARDSARSVRRSSRAMARYGNPRASRVG